MSRLIRMDHTGHTTLAEWTADDPAAVDAAVRAFRDGARPGLLRDGLDRRGPRRAGPRAAARRRARDHAPADLRRLARPRGPRPSWPPRPSARGCPSARAVHWRPLVDERRLRRTATLWTATTTAHVVPFVGAGALLFAVQPLALPVTLLGLAHAWVIPELYAHRGANVVRPKRSAARGPGGDACRSGCSATCRPRGARPARARPASCSSAGASASGSSGRPARCSCAPAAGASTATACGSNDPDLPSRRPHRPPAARAAQRRARLRHGREPRVLGRAVARAPPPAPDGPPRAGRRRPIGARPRPEGHALERRFPTGGRWRDRPRHARP